MTEKRLKSKIERLKSEVARLQAQTLRDHSALVIANSTIKNQGIQINGLMANNFSLSKAIAEVRAEFVKYAETLGQMAKLNASLVGKICK